MQPPDGHLVRESTSGENVPKKLKDSQGAQYDGLAKLEGNHTEADLKMYRAQHAEARAELAELQLHYARQETFLQELSSAAAAERNASAEQTGLLRSELGETRKREFAAVAAAAASATTALDATTALQQRHETEKTRINSYEKQLTALGAQLHLQRNATATAAGSTIELQTKLRRLQESSSDSIAAANLRALEAERHLRAAESRSGDLERGMVDLHATSSARLLAANARADEAVSHSRGADLKRVAAELSYTNANARAAAADQCSREAESRQLAAEEAVRDLRGSSNALLLVANARAEAAEVRQKVAEAEHKRQLDTVTKRLRRKARRRQSDRQNSSSSASSSSSSSASSRGKRRKSPDVTGAHD